MMPESEENAEDGRAESDIPTSGQPLSQSVDEGPPDVNPSGRTSSGQQSSPTPAPRSQTHVSNNDPAHQSNGGSEPKGRNGSPSINDVGDSKDVLEEFGWDDLEDRFCAAMDKFKKIEEDIGEEFREWLEVFAAWASVTSLHEPDRAHKRLRTRMAWVQRAETDLEEKRVHYVKVVKAFESALVLLGGL